eukprot:TRINITY_DN2978_c0_g1_i2.p1 TRINITY_DN2978_c0_g1~~TRINITY_DN2978_c0_g1_i2.p1  ORF type:complete len:168 (-),score=31.72 TRINITY_DN2978_c0_g1_i2:198-701(-)
MSANYPFVLKSLPYSKDALAPIISQETIQFHHGKHQQTYVDNLNKLVGGTVDEGKSLQQLMLSPKDPIRRNAAQIYNHEFYWDGMKPKGTISTPNEELLRVIEKDFGSFEAFKKSFTLEAQSHFGSGWAWLVWNPDQKKTQVISTHDEGSPVMHGLVPLLTCDVWEQ